ncbi:MAG: hypothetical protein ABIJ21_02475 [Nanoarchaeota archaeon]
MRRTNIIITEKKSISTCIAKALYPAAFEDDGRNREEQTDIVLHGTNEETEAGRIAQRTHHYLAKEHHDYSIMHLASQGTGHGTRTRKNIQERIRSHEQVTPEFITYYIFKDTPSECTVIMDTQGNPSRYLFKQRNSLEHILSATDFHEDIEKNTLTRPNHQPNRRKSHIARYRLFNQLLVDQCLPDGEPIDLQNIIAATDIDFAGSSIFLTLIEHMRLESTRYWGYYSPKAINFNNIGRMALSSTDQEHIREAYAHPQPFDYGRAYAGKIRSYFDFLLGETARGTLRKKGINLPIGRTITLGTRTLIETSANQPSEITETYLIFPGIPSLDEMKENIRTKAHTLLTVSGHKEGLSPSEFLDACRIRQIGTHTTRCSLAKRLEKLGLAEERNHAIYPTAFGIAYDATIGELFCSPAFNLDLPSTNLKIWDEMTAFRDAHGDDFKKSIREFRLLFSAILPYFKRVSSTLAAQNPELLAAVANHYRTAEQTPQTREHKSPHHEIDGKDLIIRGTSTSISDAQIEYLFHTEKNTPRRTDVSLFRINELETLDLEKTIRRVTGIPSSFRFHSLEGSYLGNLITCDKSGIYTVFRADGRLTRPPAVQEWEEMETTLPGDDEKSGNLAHESLGINAARPEIIKGKIGMMLCKEYNLPWVHTQTILEGTRNEKTYIAAFKSEGLCFQRDGRYTFGKVHNFESMLTAMSDKYGLPFDETEKMMEEMYLKG